jgi:AcrR family transcriptional regulator
MLTPVTSRATVHSMQQAHSSIDGPAQIPPLPRPPETPRKADVTRERLLQATHELFYEREAGPISLSEICARADTNVAMVRYCFGNKDGLMLALITRITDSFRGEFQRLSAKPTSWREKLAQHLREVVRNYMRFPYITRLLADQLRQSDGHGARALCESIVLPMAAFHEELLAEGVRAGEIRPIDPLLFFFSATGACEFLFAARPWLVHGFGIDIDEELVERYADHVIDLLMSGTLLRPEELASAGDGGLAPA